MQDSHTSTPGRPMAVAEPSSEIIKSQESSEFTDPVNEMAAEVEKASSLGTIQDGSDERWIPDEEQIEEYDSKASATND